MRKREVEIINSRTVKRVKGGGVRQVWGRKLLGMGVNGVPQGTSIYPTVPRSRGTAGGGRTEGWKDMEKGK